MNAQKFEKTCIYCKNIFLTYKSQRNRFCCKECQLKYMSEVSHLTCEFCEKQFETPTRYLSTPEKQKRKRFCSRQCLYNWCKHSQRKARDLIKCQFCEKQFEVVKTDKIRKFCSIACVHKSNVGRKVSDEHKQKISETRKRDWAKGNVYNNHRVGKTKWFDYQKPNGEVIRLQGSWEVLYASYLDTNHISYDAHTGSFMYVRSFDNTTHVYLPDFYLKDTDEYVDVKNDFLLIKDAKKLEDIKQCNPQLSLKIVTKQDLISLNLLK